MGNSLKHSEWKKRKQIQLFKWTKINVNQKRKKGREREERGMKKGDRERKGREGRKETTETNSKRPCYISQIAVKI